ncbi:MAG: type II secretion system protein GspG [Bdellovibrionaceae bacterium]|nr:type II secretion system protein GspG [Bdellovibrio sp.]
MNFKYLKLVNRKPFTKPGQLNNNGFSLAEIMIVLVIIGAIMGLILPKIREGQDNSNVRNSKIKMSEIENKVNEYLSECSKYPKSLDFLVTDTADCKNWTSNKNSKNLLKDNWNNDFVFEATDNGYNLKSLGKDKKEGGSGPEKDFYSEGSQSNQE